MSSMNNRGRFRKLQSKSVPHSCRPVYGSTYLWLAEHPLQPTAARADGRNHPVAPRPSTPSVSSTLIRRFETNARLWALID